MTPSSADQDGVPPAPAALLAAEAETLLPLFIDSVTDYAIFLLDPHGRVVSWNAGAARIKGYTAPQILGRHFSCFYTPADRAAGLPATVLQQAATTGRYVGEGWRLRQDGSRFWASVVVTAVYGPDGQLRGFGKVTRDMTARREAEANNRAKDAFLASLAHQLNTPLTTLTGWSQLLQRLLAQGHPLPPELGLALEVQTTRLTELVRMLLELSRLDLERLELHYQPVVLTELVASTLAELQPLSTRQQLILRPSPRVLVEADPERLRLVLVALLTNASKYSPEAGEITVQVQQEATTALVTVQDRGIGIPPAYAERIFARYQRGSVRVEEGYEGLGIGLYLSRALVERHGGQLWCTSTPGEGTTFLLRLPCLQVAA